MGVLNTLILTINIVIHVVRNKTIYNKIKTSGASSIGRLIGYEKKSFFSRGYVFGYTPFIEVRYADKHYKVQAVGRFGVRPCEIGEEVEVIFSHEHSDKAILVKDRHILDSYIFVFLPHLIHCTIGIVAALFIWRNFGYVLF